MIVQGNPLITWGVALLLAIGIGCCVDANPWKYRDAYQLDIKWQCGDNGSLILDFPSEEIGKLTMYSNIDTEYQYSICGARKVTERTQLLEPECNIFSQTRQFEVNIFRNGKESNSDYVVVHPDNVPQQFSYWFDCAERDSHEMHKVELLDISSKIEVNLLQYFKINDEIFQPKIIRKNDDDGPYLGEPIKLEIEIGNQNLLVKSSYLESCKLDIYHTDSGVESIYILRNSTLTPEGSEMDFRFKYTPLTRYNKRGRNREYHRRYSREYRRRHYSRRGYKPAKYTMEFKAFTLASRKPIMFSCEACSNCKPMSKSRF